MLRLLCVCFVAALTPILLSLADDTRETYPGTTKAVPQKAAGKTIWKLSDKWIIGSGTVVGGRRFDGRWNILASKCCVPPLASNVLFVDKNNKKHKCTVVDVNEVCDAAWLVTLSSSENMDYAEISKYSGVKGDECWHFSNIKDLPNGKQFGTVIQGDDDLVAQTAVFQTAVTHGDAGSAVFNNKNQIIGLIWSTGALGKVSQVYGAGLQQILLLQKNNKNANPVIPGDPGRKPPQLFPPIVPSDGSHT